MSRCRWLILVSVTITAFCVLALIVTSLIGMALPFAVLFVLVLSTIVTCAWSFTIANRFATVAAPEPKPRTARGGWVRNVLSGLQVFGVVMFVASVASVLHNQCGATLNPSTWCSVSARQVGEDYQRSINSQPPTMISRDEYQSLSAATQAAIAGMALLFAVVPLRIGLAGLDYEDADADGAGEGS
jgi:hypothetical protein